MRFEIQPHTRLDKRIKINGPDGMLLYMDYDDVDHNIVDEQLHVLLQVLNTAPKSWWEDAERHGREKSEAEWRTLEDARSEL